MKLLSVVATMMVAFVVSTPTVAAAGAQAPTPAPPARLPFPGDAKHAFADLQRVANESNAGQEANSKVQALSEEKIAEIEGRQLEVQASQQQLQQNVNVMSAEAQQKLQRDIERLTRDVERMDQDAQAEVQELQQTLQLEFQQLLVPALERVAAARGLQFIFSANSDGLIWANPALDVSQDVIAQLNGIQ